MTSRAAFEEWAFNLYKGGYSDDDEENIKKILEKTSYDTYKDDRVDADWLSWQASEQRLLAVLDSEDFIEFLGNKLCYPTSAKDLARAITTKFKGE